MGTKLPCGYEMSGNSKSSKRVAYVTYPYWQQIERYNKPRERKRKGKGKREIAKEIEGQRSSMKKHANTVKRTMIEIQTARFFHAHSFDLVRTDIMKIGSYPPGPLFNIHNKRFFASPKNTNTHRDNGCKNNQAK